MIDQQLGQWYVHLSLLSQHSDLEPWTLTLFFTIVKNFCLDQIELDSDGTASASIIQDNVDVAIHETAHVLGMSSNSYRFFWDSETAQPRTPRPFETSTVTCVDGETRSLVLPSEDTMQFFANDNGERYASIVTPKVRTIARNQFNCQSLAGAQLENQPTGSESCTGDHWDERL